MAYDISRMNEGFELLLARLSIKDLLQLVDNPRIPEDVLLNVINDHSHRVRTIIEVLGDSVLTRVNQDASLYSRLIDQAVISKYVESKSYKPYNRNPYGDKPATITLIPSAYVKNVMAATRLLEKWNPDPESELDSNLVASIKQTFKSYYDFLNDMQQARIMNDDPAKASNMNVDDVKVYKTLNVSLEKTNLDAFFSGMDNFVNTVVTDPYLSRDYTILYVALQVLEKIEAGADQGYMPEDVKIRMMTLLNESDIFRASAEVKQQFTEIQASLKDDQATIDVENFIARYNATINFLTQYERVIPKMDVSHLKKDFGRFASQNIENLAVDFATPGNTTGLLELCAAIRSNEGHAHHFMTTLTSHSREMGKIAQVAIALTPTQG